jgi:L-2-hydroxyglutarate oxidase
MSPDSGHGPFDVAIVGAGVLGATIAYWLSQLYDCSIALIDQAQGVAFHTSTRNTGVIHRPFYLNPETKRVFAVSAELSYPLWHDLAKRFGLPWRQVGTLEVALDDENVSTLEKYRSWGQKNGMPENELDLIDGNEVRRMEPEVSCIGAIYSRTDVSVDFGAFTKSVYGMAESRGVKFLGGQEVESVESLEDDSHLLSFKPGGELRAVACRFLINAAGGGSVDIAHMDGIGKDFTDLHFRGDYWLVDEPFASRVGRNIYSVARHSQFPFLDPHFVVRADGSRQIGPNAALVSGPFAYEGLGKGFVRKLMERPVSPKLRLFTNGEFLSLAWTEWRSSVSKTAMCDRVRRFLPGLNAASLNTRGLSGVRSSVIDSGGFVPEALQLEGEGSFHILNFNSPGATGAPIFSAMVVRRLRESGVLGSLLERRTPERALWDFEDVALRLDRLGRLQ